MTSRKVLRDHRFTLLLAALLLYLGALPAVGVLYPQAAGGGLWPADLALLVVLVSAANAAARRRWTAPVAVALLLAALAVRAIWFRWPAVELAIAYEAAIGLFMLLVVGAIAHHLFAAKDVRVDTIASSLCLYLLLGVLWVAAYSILELLDPGSFSIPEDGVRMGVGAKGSAVALYFSQVTLTTLGYGDVLPMTPAARAMASTEAIVGQMFLAVIVARLVGLHIVMSTSNGSTPEDQPATD